MRTEPGKSAIVLARTRAEARALSYLMRERVLRRGSDIKRAVIEVSRDVDGRVREPLEIAVGDRLRIGATQWEKQLFNGTVVTVEDFKVLRGGAGSGERTGPEGPGPAAAADPKPEAPSVLITARTDDGRRVRFRHDEIRDYKDNIRLDYGYALTIASAQGLTVDRAFLLANGRPARETIYPAATRHREALDIYVNRAPLAFDIADSRADNDREVPVTDSEIRAYLAERWSRSRPKEAALDYMADGLWEDRRAGGGGRQRAGPHYAGYSAHRSSLASWPCRGSLRRRTARGPGGLRRAAGADPRRGRRRGSGYRLPRHPQPSWRAAETGRGLPRPPGRVRLPARGKRRHGTQGPRRLRGAPCPGKPPPARRHHAAGASGQAGGGASAGTAPGAPRESGADAGGWRRRARAREHGTGQAALAETPEQRERRAHEEIYEFSRLRAAVYDARTDEEARIAREDSTPMSAARPQSAERPGKRRAKSATGPGASAGVCSRLTVQQNPRSPATASSVKNS